MEKKCTGEIFHYSNSAIFIQISRFAAEILSYWYWKISFSGKLSQNWI